MTNKTTIATTTTEATVSAKKLTKKDYFGLVREIVFASNSSKKDDILRFIDHEIELLDKKSTSKKPSGVQKANEEILKIILSVLKELDKPVTVSELLEDKRLVSYKVENKGKIETIKMSGQKLSALITSLVKTDKVVRTTDKKKAYFSLAKK